MNQGYGDYVDPDSDIEVEVAYSYINVLASFVACALNNDLFQNLEKNKATNEKLGNLALQENNCWYLKEELIALSFFSDEVSHEMKRKVILSQDHQVQNHLKKHKYKLILLKKKSFQIF